ncbi:hypothetical protein F2P81_024910 [Scophthalmus maximus]|uniref:Uncharacterized protein n=1 Tax=Scophthalmus maximus TaxID=52904 RepID=A0A6A4RRM0_SCOMX|nr:hypothetical protein F2P81_024910 [Scophthalmus maximus]
MPTTAAQVRLRVVLIRRVRAVIIAVLSDAPTPDVPLNESSWNRDPVVSRTVSGVNPENGFAPNGEIHQNIYDDALSSFFLLVEEERPNVDQLVPGPTTSCLPFTCVSVNITR